MQQKLTYLLFLLFSFFFHHAAPANFERLADIAGFTYDPNQDIYITKINAKQRIFGYSTIFDFATAPGGMIVDAEPIVFDYGGKTYMIEPWKGQYYSATGAEIGVYEWNGIGFDAVKNNDLLTMSYTVMRKGERIFDRAGRHWWLAGFFPGVFSDPSELVLQDIYIQFKSKRMRDAFLSALYALGYNDDDDAIRAPIEGKTIIFNFTSPKSPQYWTPWVRRHLLQQNRLEVEDFNHRKAQAGRTDNSPETMDAVFSPHPF